MPTEIPKSLQDSLETSKCEYRTLGKSGLRISVPVFGCMSFGDPQSQQWAIGEEEVRSTLRETQYKEGLGC